MFKKKTKFLIGLLIAVFLLSAGFGCKCTSPEAEKKMEPKNLVYWRVEDGQDAFGAIIQSFRALYPHISITYKLIRSEEYEGALLEAWAEDRGPDIFSVPNTWLRKYQSKILALAVPDQIELARQVMVGTIKKEPKIILEKKSTLSLRELRETFVETVPKDVIIDEHLYGLPLALDILTLYYNRDLLNNAGIASPPETWDEFAKDVRLLTLQDRYGNFIQSGAALGGAENVAEVTDILSLLMLQNGTPMVSGAGQAVFNEASPDDKTYFPAREALRFYADFANPNKEIYTWNAGMPNSFDAFVQGKTAFLFGYSGYLAAIKAQAPKLNFDVAKVPQISGSFKETNYARYWVETVSKKTLYPNEAWAFLLFAAEAQNAKTFIERTKRPTAHRELIQSQLEDFDLAPFAKGVLTAQTWYRGRNYALVEEAFKEMVKDVLTGAKTIEKAVDWCAQKVNLTY